MEFSGVLTGRCVQIGMCVYMCVCVLVKCFFVWYGYAGIPRGDHYWCVLVV